jgi:hypothetical protein
MKMLIIFVSIYPNPSSAKFILELNNPEKYSVLRIYDITGKVIFNDAIKEEKTEVDLSSFANGIYLLQVSSGEKLISKKLVKN